MEPKKGSEITSPNMMERFRETFTTMVNDTLSGGWHWGNLPSYLTPLELFGGIHPIVPAGDPAGIVADGDILSNNDGTTVTVEETVQEVEGPFYDIPAFRVMYVDTNTENGKYHWNGQYLGTGGTTWTHSDGWEYVRGAYKGERTESSSGWQFLFFQNKQTVTSRNFEISRRRFVTRTVTRPVPGADRTLRITGDIIEANDVVKTMAAYLSLFSRVRKMHYVQTFGETNIAMTQEQAQNNTYPITYVKQVEQYNMAHHATPMITPADAKTLVEDWLDIPGDGNPGTKVQGDIITAEKLNTTLDRLIAKWEELRDTPPVPPVSYQLCHASCHFSCHSASGYYI